MNKQEREEVETVRLILHEMFGDRPEHVEICSCVTDKLYRLSHTKDTMLQQLVDDIVGRREIAKRSKDEMDDGYKTFFNGVILGYTTSIEVIKREMEWNDRVKRNEK